MTSHARPSSDMDAPTTKKARTNKSHLSFKRIRIFSRGDLDSLYHLIAAYIEEPQLADSVEEFAFDVDSWPTDNKVFADFDSVREVPNSLIDSDLHAKIDAYVREMGLPEIVTELMLNSLQWKRGQALDESGRPQRDLQERDFATTSTAILLSLCKNITTLYMGSLGWWPSPMSLYIILSSMGRIPQPGLQTVKHVEFIAGATDPFDGTAYALLNVKKYFNYICRLPALESVVSDGIAQYESNCQMFPPRCSTMKKLQITHADLPSDSLAQILKMPKNLEEFTFSLGGLMFVDGGSPLIYLNVLGEQLSRHRDTLKILDIDVDRMAINGRGRYQEEEEEEEEATSPEPDSEPLTLEAIEERLGLEKSAPVPSDLPKDRKYEYGLTIGSFDDYKALTRLFIGIKALLGPSQGSMLKEQPPFRLIDALPPSLEHLCIYGYEEGENPEVDDHIREFLEKKQERLPKLARVEGVDEKVESEMANYDEDEDVLWERPERNFNWIKV